MRIEVLYLDKWIAVINKSEGLLSVPFSGSKTPTAQGILENIMRKRGIAGKNHRPYAVHRLDRDTSGVMMFALTYQSQQIIMNSWHKMVTGRIYRALCEKNPAMNVLSLALGEQGVIDAPLAKNAYNIGFVPRPGEADKKGRIFKTEPARTHYRRIAENSRFVLFELSLDTGKKNQIRAHLSAAGFPLLGDESHRARQNPFGRLCLHARTLEFNHPFTSEHLKFEVPESDEWEAFAKKSNSV